MNLDRAKELAIILMSKHGLLLSGWRFNFDNARRRFGVCKYRSREIGLSKHLVELNDEHQVRDTILHEIAHALVGCNHGHDWVWKAKALEIGCNGNRCYKSDEVLAPESKYIAICNKCKKIHRKHKMTKSLLEGIRNQSCGKCDSRYNPVYNLKWEINPKY